MQAIIDFLTSGPVVAVLITAGLAILDAIAAAVAGNHPLIARLLMALANLLRSQENKLPPPSLKMFAVLVVLAVFASDASAGPIRNWIHRHRHPSCTACQPAPAYQFAPRVVGCYNCTTCGNSCACFGSGYYCKDGKCPVTPHYPPRPNMVNPTYYAVPSCPSCSGGSCPGGVCPAPSRGFFRRW